MICACRWSFPYSTIFPNLKLIYSSNKLVSTLPIYMASKTLQNVLLYSLSYSTVVHTAYSLRQILYLCKSQIFLFFCIWVPIPFCLTTCSAQVTHLTCGNFPSWCSIHVSTVDVRVCNIQFLHPLFTSMLRHLLFKFLHYTIGTLNNSCFI